MPGGEQERLAAQKKKRGAAKKPKKTAKAKKPRAGGGAKRPMSSAAKEAFAKSREALAAFRAENGRNPAKGELRPYLDRVRGAASPRARGGDMPGPNGTVVDRTPQVSEPPLVKGGLKFKLDREYVVQYQPDDSLSLAAGFLFALRLIQARLDSDAARAEAILDEWFGADASEGPLPNVELKTEVTAMMQMLKVLPLVARKMGFTGEEWATSWNALAGETVGILPVGPPITPGLDAPFPPVRGTITTPFSPAHQGVDIAAPLGTPIIAPEDLRVIHIKTVGGFGNHVFLTSRRPSDGKFPLSGGAKDIVLPDEGVRVHMFGHLSTFAAGLKAGDELERGAVLGAVGSTGTSTGPHLHWQLKVYIGTDEGKVKLTAMDPTDFVPADVISGLAAGRPPSPSWTIVDPADATKTKEAPSYSVYAGGDLIFSGTKVVTKLGDIDVLSAPFRRPDEFDELRAASPRRGPVESVARFGGGVLGTLFGGAAGRRIGQTVGGGAGSVLDNLFQRRA